MISHGRVAFRHSDIVRAVRAVKRAGLEVSQTEISSDGTIRLSHEPAPSTPATAYDAWKEGRNAHRA